MAAGHVQSLVQLYDPLLIFVTSIVYLKFILYCTQVVKFIILGKYVKQNMRV
jgi:hypothetical protein